MLNTALLDLVGTELLQVVGETKLLPGPNGPLRGVILVPFNGVSVIGWELVVEVVVALSESDESGNNVVTGRVAVIERLVTEPVGQRVDTEGCLLNEEDTQNTGVNEATLPVAPAETSNKHWHAQTHAEDDLEVVAVLPYDNRVLVQIGDIGAADTLGVLLHHHPAKVGVEQALADGVRVFLGIGVAVVSPVVTSPPANGTFNCTTTDGSEPDTKREGGRIRAVSPQTMVTC